MEGKTHYFYGFMIATTFLILLSLFHTKNIWYCLLLIGNGFGIVVYKIADALDLKVKSMEEELKEKKKAKKSSDESPDTANEKGEKKPFTLRLLKKSYIKMNSFAWVVNLFLIMLTTFTAKFLDNSVSRASSIYAFMGIMLSFAGSFLCDMDTIALGIQAHRNPMTHSYFIPFLIWWYGFLILSFQERFLIIPLSMFCLGVGSHLLLDRIPSTAGFFAGLKATFTKSASPGDIRQIPEEWESLYLLLSGLFMLFCFALSIPRFYGTHGFDWSFADNSQLTQSPFLGIILFGVIGLVFFVCVYIAGVIRNMKKTKHYFWQDDEEDKKAKKRKNN